MCSRYWWRLTTHACSAPTPKSATHVSHESKPHTDSTAPSPAGMDVWLPWGQLVWHTPSSARPRALATQPRASYSTSAYMMILARPSDPAKLCGQPVPL